jgi:hypothetical protein
MRVLVSFAAVAALVVVTGCRKSEPTPEPTEFREYHSEQGRFSVRLPVGRVQKRADALNGILTTSEAVDPGRELYVVGYGDIPFGMSYDLDQGIAAFARSGGGKPVLGEGGKRGPDGWRDYEVADAKTGGVQFPYASGRVVVARGRFYVLTLFGAEARLNSPDVQKFLDSFRLLDGDLPWKRPADPQPSGPDPPENTDPQPATGGPDTAGPTNPPPRSSKSNPPQGQMLGFGADPSFQDDAPADGILIGFRVGLERSFDTPIVGTLQPIYRVDEKEVLGRKYGTKTDAGSTIVKAKPGYAVGAISARIVFGIDGFSVTFMRVNGDRLDPKDAYESNWVGNAMDRGSSKTLSGGGALVVGVIGREGREHVSAVGLVYRVK